MLVLLAVVSVVRMFPMYNIASTVKPTTCTSFSNLFYFVVTLYMFRTVFLSIIRSLSLYIQHQANVKQILLTAC